MITEINAKTGENSQRFRRVLDLPRSSHYHADKPTPRALEDELHPVNGSKPLSGDTEAAMGIGVFTASFGIAACDVRRIGCGDSSVS